MGLAIGDHSCRGHKDQANDERPDLYIQYIMITQLVSDGILNLAPSQADEKQTTCSTKRRHLWLF